MEQLTWAEAAAKGATHYFTGQPCKRGHLAPRYVVNAGCVACAKMTPAQRQATGQPRTFIFPDLHQDDHETLRTFARCLQQARLSA